MGPAVLAGVAKSGDARSSSTSGISLPSDISPPRVATEPRTVAERQMTELTELAACSPSSQGCKAPHVSACAALHTEQAGLLAITLCQADVPKRARQTTAHSRTCAGLQPTAAEQALPCGAQPR